MTSDREWPDFSAIDPSYVDRGRAINRVDGAIGRVISWCSQEKSNEQLAKVPDQGRVEELNRVRSEAGRDRRQWRLDVEGLEGLANEYDALYRRLTAPYQTISRVITWYRIELRNEERAEEPDQRRLEALRRAVAEAQSDNRRIPEMSAQELERLHDYYEMLYRRLEGDPALANTLLSTVIGWYGRELLNEEESEEPDQGRLEELERALAESGRDRLRLPLLDAEGLERMIHHYGALYRRLATPHEGISGYILWHLIELWNEERSEEPDTGQRGELEWTLAEAHRDKRRIPEMSAAELRRLNKRYEALHMSLIIRERARSLEYDAENHPERR